MARNERPIWRSSFADDRGRLLGVQHQPPVGVHTVAEGPVTTEVESALALAHLDVPDALAQPIALKLGKAGYADRPAASGSGPGLAAGASDRAATGPICASGQVALSD
jgi:hypothetical protein